ncbi:MAG: CopD family protein [Nitrospirae bacterium]|nr:CopD family protein [Nitrospirota bacterium]MCL5237556.1 CopD family protein [Nitrospirota bacterium]
MNRRLLYIFLAALILSLSPPLALATPEYAQQTGLQCKECHVDAVGGGRLTKAGEKFLEDLKAKGLQRQLTTTQHIVHLLIGYLHMMAGITWFGAILYVHILLKPAYASKGLPKGELFLGWISMIVVLITGILLTIARMPSLKAFYATRFGILLGIKIFLFLIMFSSALLVTLYIGPKLRRQRSAANAKEKTACECNLDALLQYDGREGRPAYVVYNGAIYDVSKSKLWKNGSHMRKHLAGHDLTDALKTAPHGEDKVLAMPVVGTLRATVGKPLRPFHERLFYFFAYMNLALTFLVIFVISLWRWW